MNNSQDFIFSRHVGSVQSLSEKNKIEWRFDNLLVVSSKYNIVQVMANRVKNILATIGDKYFNWFYTKIKKTSVYSKLV